MDEELVGERQFAGQDIPTRLGHWALERPDHPFLIWAPHVGPGRQWTYHQFHQAVRAVAVGLQARGVTKGDRILLHSENSPEMVLSWYACAELGAVAVTTNTRSVGPEVNYFARHAACVGAITQPQFATLVAEAAPTLGWMVVTADNSGEPPTPAQAAHGFDRFDSLISDPTSLERRPPEPMLPVGIIFTSGTTARPKAVVHTHANALWAGRVGPRSVDMGGDDVYLVFFPFFHVNAQSWGIWTTLGAGGTVVLAPRFSARRFWDTVVRYGVTHVSLIPFVVSAIAGQPVPPNRLKVGVFGRVMPDYEAALGCRVVPAFGMTETVTHATSIDPWQRYPPSSMGRPTPGYELLVVDPETGRICPDGVAGELWIRGRRGIQLFLEYLDDAEATGRCFTEDGWFRTGDIVQVGEEGNYFYRERDKDVMKVGGENVSAREVEELCRRQAGVADVAVVGRSDEMLGAVPVAFVVKSDPAADDAALAARLLGACAAGLADFKVPKAFHFVDHLPLATLHKVAKGKLREMAEARRDPAGAEP